MRAARPTGCCCSKRCDPAGGGPATGLNPALRAARQDRRHAPEPDQDRLPRSCPRPCVGARPGRTAGRQGAGSFQRVQCGANPAREAGVKCVDFGHARAVSGFGRGRELFRSRMKPRAVSRESFSYLRHPWHSPRMTAVLDTWLHSGREVTPIGSSLARKVTPIRGILLKCRKNPRVSPLVLRQLVRPL